MNTANKGNKTNPSIYLFIIYGILRKYSSVTWIEIDSIPGKEIYPSTLNDIIYLSEEKQEYRRQSQRCKMGLEYGRFEIPKFALEFRC